MRKLKSNNLQSKIDLLYSEKINFIKQSLKSYKEREEFYNKPRVFSNSDDEMTYIESYFKEENRYNLGDNNYDKHLPKRNLEGCVSLNIKERNLLIQSKKYNFRQIIVTKENKKIVNSLYKKCFIKKTKDEKIFLLTNNVAFLLEIDGDRALDEITK